MPPKKSGAVATKAPRKKTTTTKATAKKATKSASTAKAASAEKATGGGRNLVVVESPAKAKTILKYLGRNYVVKASMGHVRDLPSKKFGFDPDKDFEADYEVIASKKKVITELRKLAKAAPMVYLATDLDREGEAIAWHLAEALDVPESKQARVTFNEITKKAIAEAFEHPRAIDRDKVDAQQARRFLDRMVGYKLSPLLWRRAAPGTSAGRVQSVALRLIVEREREIRAFKIEPYWTVEARFAKLGSPPTPPAPEPEEGKAPKAPPLARGEFTATLREVDGEKVERLTEDVATSALGRLTGATYTIQSVERERKQERPAPPFTTSTLQQQAAIRLKFSAKKTMTLAQRLYQGVELGAEGQTALITYMRTDSVALSDDAVRAGRDVIRKEFGSEYLPDAPNRYKAGKRAQEAHEAIRPTEPSLTPAMAAQHLEHDEARLYELIWRRFMACQMKPSEADITTALVGAKGVVFEARGRTPVFDGWRRAMPTKVKGEKEGDADNDAELPPLAPKEVVEDRGIRSDRHETQPPPRFSEASLVRTLEREGIGRPSTYAAIISTIVDRTYVTKEKGRFRPTGLGEVVNDLLVPFFGDIINVKYTSRMEEELDEVEAATTPWKDVLHRFWKDFSANLETAAVEMKPVKFLPAPEGTPPCEKCGSDMVRKLWKGSEFLGCSKYPDCKNTRRVGADGAAIPEAEATEHVCEKCEKPMVIRTGRRGRFLACSGYPDCKNAKDIAEDGTVVETPQTDEKCEKCGSAMVVKSGRRGPFLACSGYPKCRNARDLGADGKALPAEPAIEIPEELRKCAKCGSEMVVKRSRRGPFLACPGYPKCKNAMDLPGAAKEPRKPAEPAGIDCPECGKPMVVRFSRRGPFAGCTGYPKCKGTAKM
jgi:DNA topoisomerase-1